MDILLLITKFSIKKDIAFNSCKGYVLFSWLANMSYFFTSNLDHMVLVNFFDNQSFF